MSGMGAGEASPREQGAALMRMGRFPEAAGALRRAVEQNPLDEGSWRLLGGALSSAGDAAGAVAAFQKTVALAPDSSRNHYNLALALQTAGQFYEAKTHFERALELDPRYTQAQAALDDLASQTAARGYGKTAEAEEPSTAAIGSAAIGAPAGGTAAGAAPAGGMTRMDDDLAVVGGGAPSPAPPMRAPELAPGAVGGYAPPPVLGVGYTSENTSGMQGEVPAEIRGGWNWGAAVIPVFWLWNHQMKGPAWGLFGLNLAGRAVSRTGDTAAAVAVISGIIGLIQIGVFFYLGFTGNKLGWQHRRFDSVEDFRDCQRKWMYWGLSLFLLIVVIIALAVVLPAMNAGAGRPPRIRPF